MMARALAILLALLLSACGSVPQRTVTVTTAAGETYTAPIKTVADPRIHADGSRMDYVELATVKVMGGLPPPDPTQPLWSCLATDLATTGIGLSVGLTEANPLGLVALPLNVVQIHYAKKWEKEGDPTAAIWYCRAHRLAAAWNIGWILVALL